MQFDVVTMGRVCVDLFPEQSNVPLGEVTSFTRSLGGAATNVAVAAARLGRNAAVITGVGDDQFGSYIRSALSQFGVDPRWVRTDPALRTPVVFAELNPPDAPGLLFYRQPTAPDMNVVFDELDMGSLREASLFWTTGTGLSDEPSRTTTLLAMEALAAESDAIILHDLDYRPMLWANAAQAPRWAGQAMRYADVVVGTADEMAMAVGTRDPAKASELVVRRGAKLAIVKNGTGGTLARTADGVVEVPPMPVAVVCGLGAGDAFGGALCHGLLADWPIQHTLTFANAAGAIVASRLACADAMPSAGEVAAFIERRAATALDPGS